MMNEKTADKGAPSPSGAGARNELLLDSVLRDMAEGILIFGLDGRVEYMNPAAAAILDKRPEELLGRKLAAVFFESKENDPFLQTVLNAVYQPGKKNVELVPYDTGSELRHLHVTTSFLLKDEEKIGIIMMIGNVTEMISLKNRHAQQISTLLDSLVKALSMAIEERSRYTANHTRNMVRMGTAFLDWLDRTVSDFRIPKEKRHALLMSIWLHDVGKLAVPLTVMDKATRLGDRLEGIEQRFQKIRLLDRIAFLEGRIDREAWEARKKQRTDWLLQIRRINTAGFLEEEELRFVQGLSGQRYRDEDGTEAPILSEEELRCLEIRRGTLTDGERRIMQSHAETTKRILERVEFPEAFAMVPEWAAAHHELLNGSGYPEGKRNGEIPTEVRLLTILDIFEALIASDRPYKKPVPPERAFTILKDMARAGCVDGTILALFEQSRAWEETGPAQERQRDEDLRRLR